MWNGKPIELSDWSKFAPRLKKELINLNHQKHVLVRNFDLITFDLGENGVIENEVDRLEIVRATGTDRDETSRFWDMPEFDHDHEQCLTPKKANEIIYAFVVDAIADPFKVYHDEEPETLDLTAELSEHNGILVYDASQLRRVAKNEHWFISDPKSALLLVFTLLRDQDLSDLLG